MTDLISRADAIETVLTYFIARSHTGERGEHEEDFVRTIFKALPSADAVDCTDFIEWLVDRVLDETIWENNSVAYGEIICRKLVKLGILEVTEEPSYYIRPSADAVSDAYKRGFDDCRRAYEIELARSADAVQGWMPCSDRLPNESGEYLATIPLDADKTYVEVLTFHKGRFYEDDDEWGATYHDDVLAWMPLPTPYKGGDAE